MTAPPPDGSAASATTIAITFELARAGSTELRTLRVRPGSPLRAALRALGEAAEGSAVFDGERPLPLDTPLTAPRRLTVVRTFSGG